MVGVTTTAPQGLLLDTPALLWAVNEPQRLGEAARAALEDPDNGLFVSAASVWELATKHLLGKLPQAEAWLPDLDGQVARLGARPLPVTSAHALMAGGMAWDHRDPVDRMLGAQAVQEDLVLVTQDAAFDSLSAVPECGSLRLLW